MQHGRRRRPSTAPSKQTPEQQALFKQFGAEYRQPFAESAVLALVERLGGTGKVLPCIVRTRVDQPNEVFDCYGRLVGDLFVETETGELRLAEPGRRGC